MIKKKSLIFAALGICAASLTAHADSPQEKQRERYADRIETALERDSVLGRFDLDADAKGDVSGYIEIEGKVLDASQHARALSIARREAPGYRIVDRLQIGAQPSADKMRKEQRKNYADRIEDAFERDAILARFDLDADAKGDATGYIKLEGKVRSAAQRDRALSIARRVAPGYTLKNEIQIRANAGRNN